MYKFLLFTYRQQNSYDEHASLNQFYQILFINTFCFGEKMAVTSNACIENYCL